MAVALKDRVYETSISTGNTSFTLLGAVTGYQSFSTISGGVTYYTIQGKNDDGTLTGEWEVGQGTYTAGTLSRDTVLDSSTGGAKVVFSAGTKDVFSDLPAEKVLVPSGTSSQLLANDGSGGLSNVTIGSNLTYSAGTLSATGGGGIAYPGAGIANSTGSAWGTSYTTSGSGTVVALSDSPTFTTAITSTGALQLTGDATTAQNIATTQTTGTLAIGGTGATGTISLGQATGAQTINIGGTSANANVINIGGAGASTGTITLGRSTGTQTIAIGGNVQGANTRTINIGTGTLTTGVSNVSIGKFSNLSRHTTLISGDTLTIQAQTLTLNNIGALVIGGNLAQNTNFVSGLAGLTGVVVGSRAFVTDASLPVFGSTVSGGGAVAVPVYYDGTDWRVG